MRVFTAEHAEISGMFFEAAFLVAVHNPVWYKWRSISAWISEPTPTAELNNDLRTGELIQLH